MTTPKTLNLQSVPCLHARAGCQRSRTKRSRGCLWRRVGLPAQPLPEGVKHSTTAARLARLARSGVRTLSEVKKVRVSAVAPADATLAMICPTAQSVSCTASPIGPRFEVPQNCGAQELGACTWLKGT